MLNEGEDIDQCPVYNTIDFDEKIGIAEWHSFCMAIDVVGKTTKIAQNGKTIALKHLAYVHGDIDRMRQLMNVSFIGIFSGFIGDIQVHSRALTEEEMHKWTLCDDDEKVSLVADKFQEFSIISY